MDTRRPKKIRNNAAFNRLSDITIRDQREKQAPASSDVAPGLHMVPTIRQCMVTSESGDYVVCRATTVDEGTIPGAEIEADIFVAKPYLCRRTPFEGSSRDGVSYEYSADDTRVATDDPDTETQKITPSYVVGDLIYVYGPVANGAGVTIDAGLPTQKRVSLIDINVDGRTYAEVSE